MAGGALFEEISCQGKILKQPAGEVPAAIQRFAGD